ncbi:MAG: GIY-YIG nuclease family protein [Candidatus Thermoplasmatota archaeon]|nr:GIY-YIG nuclease family protein [Candidatus Thermoplasmatota archaeon]
MAYNVYVIELDKEVLKSKKFRERNPLLNPRRACFYVGQTTHDPVTRFNQHKQGYKANSFVKRHGIRLVWRKFQKYNPIQTRKDAEQVERWLTNKLRKKGHGTWSN